MGYLNNKSNLRRVTSIDPTDMIEIIIIKYCRIEMIILEICKNNGMIQLVNKQSKPRNKTKKS